MPRKLSRRAAVTLIASAALVLPERWAQATSPGLFTPDTVAAPGARRRALLIGVSQYEKGGSGGQSRWCNLECEPDVYTLRAVLKTRFGFKDEEITCITDPSKTKHDPLLAAIKDLVDFARPGDAIYFHYSGHGAARYTAEGTPYSTLVPTDWREPGDKLGENHIASSDLLKLFGQMKKNMIESGKTEPTGSIFLTFDSCHSGKIVRGDIKFRGENPDLVSPPPPNAKQITRDEGANIVAASSPGKTRDENRPDVLGTGFAALFACLYYQAAAEISDVDTPTKSGKVVRGDMGRFSYFLAQTLAESKETTTYRDVYDLINGKMTAAGFNDQVPDLRGDTADALLNGTAIPQPSTVPAIWQADPADLAKPATLLLKSGSLLGVTAGSTYALYAIGDDPSAKGVQPVATATVHTVNLMDAVLVPTPRPTNRLALHAVETGHIYAGDPLSVSVADIRKHPQGAAIIARLSEIADKDRGLLTLTDDPKTSLLAVTRTESFAATAKITRDENGTDLKTPGFAIERVQEGTLLKTVPDTDGASLVIAATVQEILRDAARARIVKSLRNNDNAGRQGNLPPDGVHVMMRLVPCKTKTATKNGSDYLAYDGPNTDAANARGEYRDNDAFAIEVENIGTERAFLTILDLSPDGTINPIYPPGDKSAEFDSGIDPGIKRQLSVNGEVYVISLAPPFGSEQLKLIATKELVDFSPLLSTGTRGGGTPTVAQKRAEVSPIGRLFGEIQTGTRGTRTAIPKNNAEWCTATVTIHVTPKPQGSPANP